VTVAPRSLALLFAAALLALSSRTALAQANAGPERFTATAVDMNRGGSGTIEITVDRWSTDAERDRLMQVILDKGPDKLLDALQDAPRKGHFNAPGNLGWDIHFARRMPLPDGGERVVLVTDRRIGFWEVTNRPRTIDYPFTVIELRLKGDGTGEGKVSVATRIIADKENGIITLEDYDIQPVQLTTVRRERASERH
jgi:hypothetical protein